MGIPGSLQNGRGGASFKDNEGFYEFDLKMK